MKRQIIAGIALGLLAVAPATAADMKAPAPVFTKAPMMAPVYSWTGCYIGAGAGYGMWNQDYFMESDPAHVSNSPTLTGGGRGWFGTVNGGCDYQVSSSIVIGAFADWDWGSIKGTWLHQQANVQGSETEKSTWAVGGRIGWLVNPTFLAYFDGGYAQTHFGQIDLFSTVSATGPANLNTNIGANTYTGWFIGSGAEYALSFIPLPGIFWRSEYRFSTYKAADLPILSSITGLSTGTAINSDKFVQTVRSELVWRFNWGH
jgi:outer membrane immunogenic protein